MGLPSRASDVIARISERKKQKRAGYRDQVAWIADNDSPGEDDALDAETVSGLTTVVMVAHTWDKEPIEVAKDVVRARKRT